MVHFKKVCKCKKGGLYEGRIFKNGTYENRDSWEGSFNVYIQGTEAYISLLDKGWSRTVDRNLVAFCKSNGVCLMKWERRGKIKERKI